MAEPEISVAELSEIDKLMSWRMEVLRCVFAIPAGADVTAFERANRDYYARAITAGAHVALFAAIDGETAGCGGVCFHDEMPSPDNPSGRCAYLMNIYVRPRFRRRGIGAAIVRRLVAEARNRGIEKTYLETSGSGRSLYRSLGFAEMPDMMILGDGK